MKTPNQLFEKSNISCPICGKIFDNTNSLDDHLIMLKKTDPEHKKFFMERIKFSEEQRRKNNKKLKNNRASHNLKFGEVNIKKSNKNTS